MTTTNLDEALYPIIRQLMERFNLATGMALDRSNRFDAAKAVFDESLSVLELYQCRDAAADQCANFAQVAFFRQQYSDAIAYAEKAAGVAQSASLRDSAETLLHDMSYRLLEVGVSLQPDPAAKDILLLAQQHLRVSDYTGALERAREADSGFARKLALELLRQGIEKEKHGAPEDAAVLLRSCLPCLNPKRAVLVEQELRNLEKRVSHE